MKHKKSSDIPNGPFCPMGQLLYSQLKNYQNIDNKTKINPSWKYLDHSKNDRGGLTQWAFVTLGYTLTYTTSKLNNLRNCIEANKCIDGDRLNHKNQHPSHYLTQTCRGSKYVFMVLIRTTDNLKSHPRIIFRIN